MAHCRERRLIRARELTIEDGAEGERPRREQLEQRWHWQPFIIMTPRHGCQRLGVHLLAAGSLLAGSLSTPAPGLKKRVEPLLCGEVSTQGGVAPPSGGFLFLRS